MLPRRFPILLASVALLALAALAPDARAASGSPAADSPLAGNGHNVSFDGRLFIIRRGAGWMLQILRPERIRYRAGGIPVLDDAFSSPALIQREDNGENALAICEENAASTPYRCDDAGAAVGSGAYECYDLVIFDSNAQAEQYNGLRRRRLKLWIANPGTRDASLHRHQWLTTHEPLRYGGSDLRGIEPTVTRDGRLLVWQGHPDNDGKIDIVMYAVNDTPCGAGGWSRPHSITHMFNDPAVRGRYRLAERQLRAADGTPYADGALFHGGYPWVFPEGDAINFTATNMPCRAPENPVGCGPRRNAFSVIGYPTNWGLAHVDGDVNPSTEDTVRLFFSSPGPTTFEQLPVTGGTDVWPFFGSNTSNYTELVFDDALDGNYAGVWHMNESVNVRGDMDRLHTGDTSGYFNTGIVRGARFPAVNDGLWGKALTFDGDGDHVEVRNDASLNPVNGITVEAWINPSAPVDCDSRNNFRTLISKGGIGDGGYSLVFEEGERFQARVRTGGVQRTVSSSRGIPVGRWSHVGFTYDARTGDMEIFIDGEVVGSAAHPAMTLDPTASPVRIGGPGGARATCPNGDGAFEGRIDEVRISRSVRDLTFSPRPGNHAQFVDQWVPAVVGASERFTAHLTFRNVGTTAWASGTEHRLGSQAPMDTGRWGTGRIDLPRRVLPGQAVTIIVTVDAPAALGDHAFQWQLLQEGAEWFGELSQSVNVEVVPTGTAPDAGMPPPIDAGPPPGSDGGMAGGDGGGVPPTLDASIAPGYDGGVPPGTDGGTSSLDGGTGGGMDGGCSVGGSRSEMPLVFLTVVAFAFWRRRGRTR